MAGSVFASHVVCQRYSTSLFCPSCRFLSSILEPHTSVTAAIYHQSPSVFYVMRSKVAAFSVASAITWTVDIAYQKDLLCTCASEKIAYSQCWFCLAENSIHSSKVRRRHFSVSFPLCILIRTVTIVNRCCSLKLSKSMCFFQDRMCCFSISK